MTTHEDKKEVKHSPSYLRRVLDVMEVYQNYKRPGVMDIWVFRNYIQPRFYISYTTFLRYLDVPAKKLLNELEHENDEDQATSDPVDRVG